jgi:NhaP-type Na+/H+ or K+/H+ antiporter
MNTSSFRNFLGYFTVVFCGLLVYLFVTDEWHHVQNEEVGSRANGNHHEHGRFGGHTPSREGPREYHSRSGNDAVQILHSDSKQMERTDLIPADVIKASAPMSISAAEKLMCPKYVVEFVINATDTKDECEGLRKAYDFTCGGGRTVSKKGEHKSTGLHGRLLQWVVDLKEYDQDQTVQRTNDPTRSFSILKSYIHNGLDRILRHRRNLESEDIEVLTTDAENKHIPVSPALPITDKEEITDEIAAGALSLNADLNEVPQNIMGNESPNKIEDHQSVSPEEKKDGDNVKELDATTTESIATPVYETQTCCKSILQVFHEECDSNDDEGYDDKRLFVIVLVIALCLWVKSLIRHFHVRWIPEAGGCILVGMFGGLFLKFFPNMDFGFQHDMFLRLMVPPIGKCLFCFRSKYPFVDCLSQSILFVVFEAALNIDKGVFMHMAVPIFMFAILGTLMSTCLTAGIIFYGAPLVNTAMPFVECLAFGALISSIDPIAVLSVLNNMGMSNKDAIYVLIFGESLLNDGVAIVLFQTLLHFMDESMVIDSEAVWLASLHFLVIATGSLLVGLACGVAASAYFWLMKGIQTPLVEVLTFLCWAFVPYYISDGIEWSGIVSIVAAGFFMDIYVIGNRTDTDTNGDSSHSEANSTVSSRTKRSGIFSQEGFLSSKAKTHIGFVTEINSTLMETAIFAYLGIFLFNKRYHWTLGLPVLAVFSCIASRSVMIFIATGFANMVAKVTSMSRRSFKTNCRPGALTPRREEMIKEYTKIDGRMQIVLIFAGLRGAMSFALVETVPMYDTQTHQGSRFKPELKAMTSACIVFTVFVLGGSTYYLLERLGLGPTSKDEDAVEMVSLLAQTRKNNNDDVEDEEEIWTGETNSNGTRRRKHFSVPCPHR